MFDVGFGEFLVLGVLALVIFGDKLPTVAAQAGRAMRQVRQMAMSAKHDLQEGLGPDFADFDPADLHPRRFVQKHLFSDIDDEPTGVQVFEPPKIPDWDETLRPPFDREAT